MGILKKLYRSALDHELGVLGGQVDELNERLSDIALQAETLRERFDRLQNRVGMRQARAARSAEGAAPPGSVAELGALLERHPGPGFDPDRV